MSEDIRRKMRELEKQVEHHMHLYYDLDAPELEDYEYDRLIHSLMDLEEQYPAVRFAQFADQAGGR